MKFPILLALSILTLGCNKGIFDNSQCDSSNMESCITIGGTIYWDNKDFRPFAHKTLRLSYEYGLNYARTEVVAKSTTNDHGSFKFILPSHYDGQKLNLQFYSDNPIQQYPWLTVAPNIKIENNLADTFHISLLGRTDVYLSQDFDAEGMDTVYILHGVPMAFDIESNRGKLLHSFDTPGFQVRYSKDTIYRHSNDIVRTPDMKEKYCPHEDGQFVTQCWIE